VQGPTRQRIGFDRAWLKLATNVPTRIVVDYFLESSPSDIQSEKPSARGKEHVVQLTNLLPDTTYAFAVVAVDDKAKLTSASVAGSFRTAKGPDITAPKIQGAPSVASIADTRAKIIWKRTSLPTALSMSWGLWANALFPIPRLLSLMKWN
jgi:hypothetical protein